MNDSESGNSEPKASNPSKEFRKRWYNHGLVYFILATVFVSLGALAVRFLPQILATWWIEEDDKGKTATLVGPAAQVVLWCLGGFIAVVGVGLSFLKFREEKLSAVQRLREHNLDKEKEGSRKEELEQQRLIDARAVLRTRFVSSVELLSSPDATMRTAGLYALAALAEDWFKVDQPDEAQVCVDVMCGYLRSPRVQTEEQDVINEKAVRRAGLRIIGTHLARGERDGWKSLTYDLSNSLIDFEANLGIVDLHQGRIDFSGSRITDGGILRIGRLVLNIARLSLERLTVENGVVHIANYEGRNGVLLFDYSTFDAGSCIIGRAHTTGRPISAKGVSLSNISRFVLNPMTISSRFSIELVGLQIWDTSSLKLSSATFSPNGIDDDFENFDKRYDVWVNLEAIEKNFESSLDFGGPGIPGGYFLPGRKVTFMLEKSRKSNSEKMSKALSEEEVVVPPPWRDRLVSWLKEPS
ncbi:hypothetical protein [Arthrobacter woluwensis]|uniref:hypothetical protein n=1 Tax=Arthrobacter woluwensis TaxID=156980 RepID=UPI0037FF1E90